MINDGNTYEKIYTLSFDDFMELDEKEKGERYIELSSKDKYRVRLTDVPKATIIGYCRLSEEQKEKGRRMINVMIKNRENK